MCFRVSPVGCSGFIVPFCITVIMVMMMLMVMMVMMMMLMQILMMMLAILYPLDDDLYLPPCVERIQPSKEGGPAW